MTTSVTDDRQAFEAWAKDSAYLVARVNFDGRYLEAATRVAFEAWQAALRSRGKVAELAENRGLQTGLALGWRLGQDNDTETFNSVSATYDREAREMRQEQCLTAIIGEGD